VAFLTSWWVYLTISIIFLYVMVQSIVTLFKARKRALELGFSKEQINQTITSSMVFSLAPSLAILIGLVALTKVFGSMVAGMRLATLGAVTYELPAAINVINGVFGREIGDTLTPDMVITAVWVMTLGCIPPLIIIPFFFKKMSLGMKSLREKDQTWNQIMMDALFLGMISAFVGYILAPKTPEGEDPYISVLGILVLVTSAALIMILGYVMKKYKWEWLKNYALPVSMIVAMALAIVYAGLGVR
jgi:sterol desaturase/sphingolipid hydroxylase (fatty acid hydroxylase superfamily)